MSDKYPLPEFFRESDDSPEDAPTYGVLLPAGFGMQVTTKNAERARGMFEKEAARGEPVILWRLDHGQEDAVIVDRRNFGE